eukprot:gene4323-5049_t
MLEGTDDATRYDWTLLPFLALPDGVHNSTEDYTFFILTEVNPKVQPPHRLYGVSQFRQVLTRDLPAHALSSDDTRSSVAKSICILSNFVASYCYFNQGDFNKMDLLVKWYDTQNKEFADTCRKHEQQSAQDEQQIVSEMVAQRVPVNAEMFYQGISLRKFITHFGRNSLVLFKLAMLERGTIVFCPQPIHAACEAIIALVSLFPRSFDTFVAQNPSVNQTHYINWSRDHRHLIDAALPLQLFTSKSILQPYMSLHQMSILTPPASAATAQDSRVINNFKSFTVGTSNNLFLKSPPQTTHAIVDSGRTVIADLNTFAPYNEWWIRSWAATKNFYHWRNQIYKITPSPIPLSNHQIHPSGPPSDILDNLQDKLTNSMKDLEPLTTGISKALFGASSFLFSSGQSFFNKVMEDDGQTTTTTQTSPNHLVETEVEEIMKEGWTKVQENSYYAATKAASVVISQTQLELLEEIDENDLYEL